MKIKTHRQCATEKIRTKNALARKVKNQVNLAKNRK